MPMIISTDKTTAVYLAEPIADFLAVSFTTILFIFQFRKALKEMDLIRSVILEETFELLLLGNQRDAYN